MSCSTQTCIIKWLSVPGVLVLIAFKRKALQKENMPWSHDYVDLLKPNMLTFKIIDNSHEAIS